MKNFKKAMILVIVLSGLAKCEIVNLDNNSSDIKTKSITISHTRHYNIFRKDSKDELFTGDITFGSSDKFISFENPKWVLPLDLKVIDGEKVVWESKLGGDDKIEFIVPTDILKSGMRIRVKNSFFGTLLMDSEIK